MGESRIRADYEQALAERVAWAQRQRTALLAAIEDTREARSLMFADDEHDPDGSTASLDQARDAALLASTETLLEALARAQQRLAAGDFGHCETCGDDIAVERLLARPETSSCIGCAQRRERRRAR